MTTALYCTYARIPVTDADIRRLARGLGKSPEQVRDKHTKVVGGERVLDAAEAEAVEDQVCRRRTVTDDFGRMRSRKVCRPR